MFTLNIVTPRGNYARKDIDSITMETYDGQQTLLANHMPIVIPVNIGVMYTKTNGEKEEYAASEGLLTFEDNVATLMVSSIENVAEIDFNRARRAKERAEERLQKQTEMMFDHKRAELALKRSLARLRLENDKKI